MYILSKSTFLRGIQCHKSLFLNKYSKDLKDKLSYSQEALFEQGTNVGLLARELFPGGVEVSNSLNFNYDSAISKTFEVLKSNGLD